MTMKDKDKEWFLFPIFFCYINLFDVNETAQETPAYKTGMSVAFFSALL